MSQRITIEIKDKIATCLTELPVVCGNSDYVVDFVFDEEWNAHDVKTAIFVVNGKATYQVFAGTACPVPVIQNTLIAWVGVFAGTVNDGTLSTSTPALVKCIPCITDGDNVPLPPPDDVYNQIIDLINSGILKGEQGEQGEKGDTPQRGVDYWTSEDKQEINDYIDKEISEFDFVKVLDSLPEVGLPNREYFIRKSSDDTTDLFEEWAWINKGTEESPNWGWEFKGTKKFEIDLSDYVKKSAFNPLYGFTAESGNVVLISSVGALESRIDMYPVTGGSMDEAWKLVATGNRAEWTDADYEKFYAFIGAVQDYHKNRNGLARFKDGKLDVTDGLVNSSSPHAVNGRVLYKQIEAVKTAITNNYSVQYFSLGDVRDTSVSTLKLGANSMFIITENESYQASAKGSVDVSGSLTDGYDLLPHDKTGTLGKYYDVATTIFIISNGENSPYTNRTDMRSVVRMTLDGLSTSLKFFWVKEQEDGTVLTLSMKSTGQHRECVLLGNKKIG